jgi:hypothetical protein
VWIEIVEYNLVGVSCKFSSKSSCKRRDIRWPSEWRSASKARLFHEERLSVSPISETVYTCRWMPKFGGTYCPIEAHSQNTERYNLYSQILLRKQVKLEYWRRSIVIKCSRASSRLVSEKISHLVKFLSVLVIENLSFPESGNTEGFCIVRFRFELTWRVTGDYTNIHNHKLQMQKFIRTVSVKMDKCHMCTTYS